MQDQMRVDESESLDTENLKTQLEKAMADKDRMEQELNVLKRENAACNSNVSTLQDAMNSLEDKFKEQEEEINLADAQKKAFENELKIEKDA